MPIPDDTRFGSGGALSFLRKKDPTGEGLLRDTSPTVRNETNRTSNPAKESVMVEPDLDKLVQELNDATAAEQAAMAPKQTTTLRTVPEGNRADKLIALAKGSFDAVSTELSDMQRKYEIDRLNIAHDARGEVEKIMKTTEAKLENLAAEHRRNTERLEGLLELYSKIKF